MVGVGVWVGVGKGGEKMRYEGNVNNGMAVRRKAQSETENDLRTVRTVVHASQKREKKTRYMGENTQTHRSAYHYSYQTPRHTNARGVCTEIAAKCSCKCPFDHSV